MNNNIDPRRHLPLEGTYNVRDMGGYETRDGRETRWRTIFRAARMSNMTLDAQRVLLNLGVRTVIDLRGESECEESPNVFRDSPDILYLHYDIIGEEIFDEWQVSPVTGNPVDRLSTIYRTLLDRRGEKFCQTLATLAKLAEFPIIYQCSAGKDRTGIVSALLLGISGVLNDVIAEDYGLSAVYLKPESYTVDDYRAEWCPPVAMQKTLQHLNEYYGGIEGYVTSIGVTQEQVGNIRELFVVRKEGL